MHKSLKVLEVIKKSFQLVFEEPSIIGIFLLPVLLVVAVVFIPILLGFGSVLAAVQDIRTLLIFSPLIFLTTVLLVIVGIWITMIGVGATVLKVEAKMKKRKMKYEDAYKKGFRNSGRLFVAYLAEEGITSLGYLLLIIPGIYLAIRLALVIPGCVLEKRGFGIKRSWLATRGNFWRILLLLAFWVAIFLLTSIIPYLMITWILILPAYITCLTLVYMKLRR